MELEVFVAKDGLLAAAGHDLRLRARAEVELSPLAVLVTVDASSLTVDGAMRHGALDPHGLTARDKADIEATIRDRVLEAARHPYIVFRSTKIVEEASRYRVEGVLSLRGIERAIAFDVTRTPTESGEHHEARVVVHQPDFGIRPYRAMLGALSVKADVEVHYSADVLSSTVSVP